MNRKEVNKYIRSISSTKQQNRCSICNKKTGVQNHHIFKVEDLTSIAWHNNFNEKEKIEEMYIPTVSLCDEHHKMLHSLMEDNFSDCEINLEDIYKVVDIISQIDLENVPELILDDYIDMYNNMVNNIIMNFINNNDLTAEELELIYDIIDSSIPKYTIEEIGGEEYERDVD